MTQGDKDRKTGTSTDWYRIPDGTKVRHRLDKTEGVIDGVTEIVSGSNLNGDGRTLYRVRAAGTAEVKLVAEDDLLFVADRDGLVLIFKQSVGYRTYVTERLRSVFIQERFVA